jgi:arylsulfatase A-like enzyme
MRSALYIIALGTAFASVAESNAADAPARPNLVLLLTDDQRADCLSCAGHPLLKTPNIDRLAKEGAHFRNAFVTTSICCVSRASYFTGRLGRNHKVGDFNTPLPADVLAASFPALLKKAGYRTACFGKWGIGGAQPKGIFDVWDAWGGQGEYFLQLDGQKVHNSEYLARRALDFIRGTPADQPFCLIVLFKAPHDPFQPDPRDVGLFEDVAIKPPKTATKEHLEAMPPFLRESLGRAWALRDIPTADKYEQYVKNYLRLIAGVDRSVGQILQALDDQKHAQQTLVAFASDNGYFLGEHGLVHKWLMYEESIRVPLIVRYPQLPKERQGIKVDELALNIDLAPTFLDFAGLEIPRGVDGASLRPLLEGKPARWRKDFFYEHHFSPPKGPAIPRAEGIRTQRSKYITYLDPGVNYEELYDLRADPLEEHNLAGARDQAEQLRALRKRYQEYVAKLPPAVLPSAKGKTK